MCSRTGSHTVFRDMSASSSGLAMPLEDGLTFDPNLNAYPPCRQASLRTGLNWSATGYYDGCSPSGEDCMDDIIN